MQIESEAISLIVEAISSHSDASGLKLLLNRCPVKILTQWKDENLLDLIHHCIIQNNIAALLLLLSRGQFKSPYKPATWPYLHLVACMGHKSFIPSLVQELNYHNEAVTLDWTIYHKAIKPKIKDFKPVLEEDEEKKELTPIDIAALFGHIGCVMLLLDFWQNQKSRANCRRQNTNCSSLYLSLACQVRSPNALRLLLTEHSDRKEALECALRMLVPECVDVMLREAGTPDLKNAFQGMNLFHVLYSYSSCLTSLQYESMVEITSILIRHKQDVNALRPSRTFPLHSLLSHSMAGSTLEECAPFLIAALLLLLKAGADPNVDEILIEEELNDPEESTAFGRPPYSSAVSCLLTNLPRLKVNAFETSPATDPMDKYAYKCIELLLRNGADLSSVGKFNANPSESDFSSDVFHQGTSLHLMISTRPLCHISYPILRLVLHYGIDADVRGIWHVPKCTPPLHLQYALNILPFSLWTMDPPNTPYQRKKQTFTDSDLKIITCIMKFMSHKYLTLAYREFLDAVQHLKIANFNTANDNNSGTWNNSDYEESAMYKEITKAFDENTREPWLLQRCCSHTVWRSCRMHMGNIYALPIPVPLQNIIMNFH